MPARHRPHARRLQIKTCARPRNRFLTHESLAVGTRWHSLRFVRCACILMSIKLIAKRCTHTPNTKRIETEKLRKILPFFFSSFLFRFISKWIYNSQLLFASQWHFVSICMYVAHATHSHRVHYQAFNFENLLANINYNLIRWWSVWCIACCAANQTLHKLIHIMWYIYFYLSCNFHFLPFNYD